MIKFIFRAIFALLMVGIVFGLVGMYLWEVTGREDYVAPAEVEEDDDSESFQWDGYSDSAPQWSPDGSSIVFRSTRSEDLDVWVVSSDGSSLRNITENNQRTHAWPVYSPDGQSITFEALHSLNTDIWIMGADGSNPTNLTVENDVILNRQPEWSPDGQTIAYNVINSELRHEIQVVDVISREIRILASSPEHDYFGFDWSPDGTEIAVVESIITENEADIGTNPSLTQVSIFSTDGSLVRTYYPTQPVSDVIWSPQGDKFLLIVPDNTSIFAIGFIILNLDGSETAHILDVESLNGIDWSPDGNKIVFSEGNRLMVANSDGSNITTLIEGSDNFVSEVVWSPDGQKIAFAGWNNSSSEINITNNIWVVDADGSNLVNLTG